jgi:hypothetical protein
VRGLTRDRASLRAGPDRRLRLLPLVQPLVLRGFRLYLLCSPDGLPIGFELAPANAPERVVAAELLEHVLQPGQTVICDKVRRCRVRATHPLPRRHDPPPRPQRRTARFGSLGGLRQWIESTFDTLKDQLSLERYGGRTLNGLISRIARRLLALTAVILHNWQLGKPGRRLTAYDH